MQHRNYVENLPGRHYIPDRMLVSFMGLDSTEELKKRLTRSFAMGWKGQLKLKRRLRASSRNFRLGYVLGYI